jgi:hypothetical protein
MHIITASISGAGVLVMWLYPLLANCLALDKVGVIFLSFWYPIFFALVLVQLHYISDFREFIIPDQEIYRKWNRIVQNNLTQIIEPNSIDLHMIEVREIVSGLDLVSSIYIALLVVSAISIALSFWKTICLFFCQKCV